MIFPRNLRLLRKLALVTHAPCAGSLPLPRLSSAGQLVAVCSVPPPRPSCRTSSTPPRHWRPSDRHQNRSGCSLAAQGCLPPPRRREARSRAVSAVSERDQTAHDSRFQEVKNARVDRSRSYILSRTLHLRLVHEKVKAMFTNFTINAHPMAIMAPRHWTSVCLTMTQAQKSVIAGVAFCWCVALRYHTQLPVLWLTVGFLQFLRGVERSGKTL